jgi:prevent-host-death family protein
MAETVVNIHAAKTQLSQLVARVEKGERITIARAGKPVAQLVPAPKPKRHRLPPDDPLLRLDEWGFDGPVGKLTNTEIDRIVYGI